MLALLVVLLTGFWLMNRSGLALPSDIKANINFKVVYPAKDYRIDNNSFQYLNEADTLLYKASAAGRIISMSQQPTPDNFDLEKVVQGASQTLTQGKGYTLINTKLGQAAITSFYSDKDLSKISQSAILESNGTLVTAQLLNEQSWSQADWEKFLNSLRLGK